MKLNLVKLVDEIGAKDYAAIQEEYKDIFQGLGCIQGEHSIKVDPEKEPVIHARRKVPFALK